MWDVLLGFALARAKEIKEKKDEIPKGPRNVEEQKCVDYFMSSGGCLCGCLGGKKRIKDEEYDKIVTNKLNKLNLKERALTMLGLDESQLKEVEPILLQGYNFSDTKLSSEGRDGYLRSHKYDVTWLFFSNSRVFIYRCTFFMTSDIMTELIDEYAYTDITNFFARTDTEETYVRSGCLGLKVTRGNTKEKNSFGLVVPGAEFNCWVDDLKEAKKSISALKQKLRDKKH